VRVLHILAPGAFGGLERVVQSLAHGQVRAGDEVHVAAVLDQVNAGHPLLGTLAAGGVSTHAIVLSARGYWRERAAILELCGRVRPVVVHTHGYRADVVDAAAARRLGTPTVTTVHGFTGGDWKNRLYERLQRRAYREFAAVVAVSRPLAEQLIRDDVPPRRVHCVPNAWPETGPPLVRQAARRALGLPKDGFLIGWVGRLSGEKGPDVLLDALAHVTDLPIGVSVMGNGREQRSLTTQARRLGVERLVRWHGTVPEAGRHFAAFDVFVSSSRTEGTPIVLFEAMAAGVPIIATRVGGVPDVVSPLEATLVPPDDPFALAVAIRAAFCNPTAGRERAVHAHARLRTDFTTPPWLERYAAIYRLVSRAGSPTAVAVEP
jgi:glycosyltransferase involved in cell wall biosynthesis